METVKDDYARSTLATVFVLPFANGLMHLPPAIGATWTALGRRDVLDGPGLLLLFAIHVLIDGTYNTWLRSEARFLFPSECFTFSLPEPRFEIVPKYVKLAGDFRGEESIV